MILNYQARLGRVTTLIELRHNSRVEEVSEIHRVAADTITTCAVFHHGSTAHLRRRIGPTTGAVAHTHWARLRRSQSAENAACTWATSPFARDVL